MLGVFKYMEVYFNTKRLYSALDYVSPAEYEQTSLLRATVPRVHRPGGRPGVGAEHLYACEKESECISRLIKDCTSCGLMTPRR